MTDDKEKKSGAPEEKPVAEKPTRPIRISREDIIYPGPLAIPDRFKKPGMHYFFMKDVPGRFEIIAKLGYDVAKDDKGEVYRVVRKDATLILCECGQEVHEQVRALKNEMKVEESQSITESGPNSENIFRDKRSKIVRS